MVETSDFLKLVNKNSGKDFTPFFNFYLETTNLLDVAVDSVSLGEWKISVHNIDFDLPMELEINSEIQRITLGKEPVFVESDSKIIVDPNRWYLHASDFLE